MHTLPPPPSYTPTLPPSLPHSLHFPPFPTHSSSPPSLTLYPAIAAWSLRPREGLGPRYRQSTSRTGDPSAACKHPPKVPKQTQ